jgi:fibronectin-binding autotransporter adhesin
MAATGDTTTLNLQNNNNSNGGSLIISGLVSDGANGGQLGISAGFPGTVFLANNNNTFTGRLNIGQGSTVNVSSLSNYGVASAIGASTGDTANTVGLVIGGTLQYTGSTAQSTNRNIQIAAPVATIDASGGNPSATLNFTHNSANINLFPNFNARTLDLTGSNTGRNTFSIWLTDFNDPTSLTKSGTGTWVLNATGNGTSTGDSYSGATTVTAGTLLVDSAIVSSPFTVNSAATLAGDGSTGTLTVNTGGILAPGDNAISGTTLSATGGATLANSSVLDFTLGTPNVAGGTAGSDLLKTTTLSLGAGITVNVTQGAGFGLGTYSLIAYSGTLTGNFTGWTVAGLPGGETGAFSIGTDNGASAVQLTISRVPEPASLALMAAAGAGILLLVRRRRPA